VMDLLEEWANTHGGSRDDIPEGRERIFERQAKQEAEKKFGPRPEAPHFPDYEETMKEDLSGAPEDVTMAKGGEMETDEEGAYHDPASDLSENGIKDILQLGIQVGSVLAKFAPLMAASGGDFVSSAASGLKAYGKTMSGDNKDEKDDNSLGSGIRKYLSKQADKEAASSATQMGAQMNPADMASVAAMAHEGMDARVIGGNKRDDFMVPDGYPDDSYPLAVKPGTHVKVTSAKDVAKQKLSGEMEEEEKRKPNFSPDFIDLINKLLEGK